MRIYILLIGFVLALSACDKTIDYSLQADLPAEPDFQIDPVPNDPNRFIVTDLSQGNLSRVWDFGEGMPATSTLKSDTVLFTKAGEYDITLHIASESGGGNAFSTKPVNVAMDVEGCQLLFLNEDCTEKCWRLSGLEGGVKVGPVPFSGEWYTSPDIVPSQADDRWCFSEDGTFRYENFGATFSACAGFIDLEDYEIPAEMTYTFSPGSGQDGLDRISLSDLWMGVEDSGSTYDIAEVSEEEMMLLAPIKPCDGAPSPGWFTLTFFKAE